MISTKKFDTTQYTEIAHFTRVINSDSSLKKGGKIYCCVNVTEDGQLTDETSRRHTAVEIGNGINEQSAFQYKIFCIL